MSVRATIVIPNRNSPLVGETVDAILASDNATDSEILVVGRDDPRAVPKASGVRSIELADAVPPAVARNLGAAEAEAELILFTDADCRPAPDWLARMTEALEAASIVGGSVNFDLGAPRWAVADNIAAFHGLMADRPVEPNTTVPLGTLNLGVRREAWNKVGTFDQSLVTSEDFDWFYRARRAGIECRFDPSIRVTHASNRATKRALIDHAEWYGRYFHLFRARHPGVFDKGFSWQTPHRLRALAWLKSWVSAIEIYRNHPRLWPAINALPAVALFRRTWYRTVAEHWKSPA